MSRAIFLLDLKKHRKLFLSIVAIVVLTFLVGGAGIVLITKTGLVEALLAIGAIVVIGGLPFFATVLGVTAGAMLVHETERGNEEAFPVGDLHRVLWAYLASLCYLIATGILIAVLCFRIVPPTLLEAYYFPNWAAGLVPLHLIAFLLGFWLRQPILAGGLALIAVGSGFLFLFSKYVSAVVPHELLGSLLLAITALAALCFLAGRLLRGRKVPAPISALIIGLLFSVLVIPAVVHLVFFPPAPPQAAKRPAKKSNFPSVVLSVPSAAMRTALKDAYRPKPDRRFFLALEMIDSFFTGREPELVQSKFENSEWVIRYRNQVIGTLPEFPDFEDGYRLLSDFTRKLQEEHPLDLNHDEPGSEVQAELDQLFLPHPFQALEMIDRDWARGSKSAEHLRSATRGLVLLTLQLLDKTEIGDQIPSRAMAFLAVSEAVSGEAMLRERCLLSRLLGYTVYAEKAAGDLPEDDPVRLFILEQENALLKQARKKNHEAQYLYLVYVAENSTVESLYSAMREFQPDGNLSFSFGKPAIEIDDFDLDRDFSRRLLAMLTQSLDSNAKEQTKLEGLPALIHSFDSRLMAVSDRKTGPFLDEKTFSIYYRAYFSSALYTLGLFYADKLSSVEATTEFASELKGNSGGTSADFTTWFDHISSGKQGKPSLRFYSQDLSQLQTLGIPPLYYTLRELDNYTWRAGDLQFLAACRTFAERADTRPSHLAYLQNVARYNLNDVRWAEELAAQMIRLAEYSYPAAEIWYRGISGDVPRLQKLLNSSRIPAGHKTTILDFMKTAGASPQVLRRNYEKVLQEEPREWKPHREYVEYLRDELHDFQSAKAVARSFRDRVGPSGGFDYIFSSIALARTCRKEGSFEEAWRAIEPVIDSWQAGAMQEAALILEGLGRHQEAVEMSRRVLDRYPDSIDARANFAEVLWIHHDYSEAATVLMDDRTYKISPGEWYWTIGDRFISVLSDKPQQAKNAFVALKEGHVSRPNLYSIAWKAGEKGHLQLAFDLIQLLPPGTRDEKTEASIRSYKFLKELAGQESALNWLRPRFDTGKINNSIALAHNLDQFELEWSLVPKDMERNLNEYVWVFRTLALLQTNDDPHRKDLVDYYSSRPAGYHRSLGFYLLGMGTEEKVLRYADADISKRCELSYYLGLKAASEGDYSKACEWLRVSMETGQEENIEYRWAYDALRVWRNKKMSLARMAKQPVSTAFVDFSSEE